jgi:uncharacterized protein
MFSAMRTLFSALIAAIICTTATASTPAPPPPLVAKGKVKPGLWVFGDADTTIYLFGTIHVLPRDFKWRSDTFNKVAARADELMLEVADLDDPARTAQTFTRLALSPNLPPVLDRVPADKRMALDKVILKSGLPHQALDRFESWAVAITLAGTTLREMNLSPDDGVERLLTTQFKGAGKRVSGLETSEWQLGVFDKLPVSAQNTFLVGIAEDQSDPRAEFKKMLRAWTSGDTKAIALTFDDEMQLSAELTEVLLRQRNRNWTELLARRLEKPGTVLVAVGAGHLAGADSVQSLLKARGIKVKRVQ